MQATPILRAPGFGEAVVCHMRLMCLCANHLQEGLAAACATGAGFFFSLSKSTRRLFCVLCVFWCEQIRRTQDEPQWIVAHRLLSHLQYLDSVKSSAKDLSLPKSEIAISHYTFNGKRGSYATGPRPNGCHVTIEAVDNTA